MSQEVFGGDRSKVLLPNRGERLSVGVAIAPSNKGVVLEGFRKD
ncbi:MAG: hypothetical protein ACFB8W_24075 [Elainellaceae cyanobacterium]